MSELVPGYPFLGIGFSSFGSYDISATDGMARLFDTSKPSFGTWTNPATGVNYELPENVTAAEVESRSARSVVFNSRSELSEFLNLQAGVSGSYLSFSGALSAQYTGITKNTSEYEFGMAYAYSNGYTLRLNEAIWSLLLPAVQNDPDIKALPPKYNADSQAAYFRVLEKYGAYFVDSVHMGGRLFYNGTIEKSFELSSNEVKASLSMEYAAVFDANAKGEWSKVNKTWAKNRSINIQSIGGDTGILEAIGQPAEGQSFAPAYSKWVASVGARPGPVGFSLREFASLFPGDLADQMRSATKAFTTSSLRLEVEPVYPPDHNIILSGQTLLTPVEPGRGTAGVAVIDSKTLKVLAKDNFTKPFDDWKLWDYKELLATVAPYQGNPDTIFAIVIGQDNSWALYPSGPMHDLLLSIGAGAGLKQWTEPSGSGTAPSAAYAIVGVPGSAPNSALEDVDLTAVNAGAGVDLYVPLRPNTTGSGVSYVPS